MSIPLLYPNDYTFPDPFYALEERDGLVGISRDLDTGRLLSAYRQGIFPWFSEDGWFFWYTIDPRAVIVPENLHIGRSLAKTLRNKPYRVTVNQCFETVIAHCAAFPRPGQDGTWIVPEFQAAYTELHRLGHAHSFECFYPDETGRLKLAGGFYGVQIGRVFYGESMFALEPDASKIAFARAVLNVHLNDSLYNDVQLRREHESTSLLPGRNYTQLEHHWDLAYGYYQYWLPFIQTSGLSVLRESRIKIYNAFALGRQALTEFRYDEVQKQLLFIRAELSKVAAVRAMSLLVGEITLANLDEDINNALVFLSKGCGAVYGLQFTLQASGKPHLSYEEATRYIAQLTAGNGLWDKQRLLGAETTEGSLRNVAAAIGRHYGLTLDDIKRSN